LRKKGEGGAYSKRTEGKDSSWGQPLCTEKRGGDAVRRRLKTKRRNPGVVPVGEGRESKETLGQAGKSSGKKGGSKLSSTGRREDFLGKGGEKKKKEAQTQDIFTYFRGGGGPSRGE